MKNKGFMDSFKNALQGIYQALKSERNMKLHFVALAVVIAMSAAFRISGIEFLFICLAAALVITCELFNTAIEVLTNILVTEYHPKVKIIKDVSAGAVLISAVFSVIVGFVVFFDRIIDCVQRIL